MRLFRQAVLGDWAPVVKEMTEALKAAMAACAASSLRHT
jgi:hypothetical protein